MASKKSIVAVDDSRIVLQTLESMLNDQYEFRAFTKAARALNSMIQFTPSLIILDIDMPEVDGYAMLEKIRENIELRGTPVIFITSNSEKNYVEKAMKNGADDYVVKPVNKDVLIGKIETLLP